MIYQITMDWFCAPLMFQSPAKKNFTESQTVGLTEQSAERHCSGDVQGARGGDGPRKESLVDFTSLHIILVVETL